ncbi:bifunctional adenosylcobinamide kinase/adenosylcobinamide-phosphate guanylyltransferase (plasmid) [Photobacterium sp. GJ3]|uniref:bifunctional adenosylcobinamide kinase/adenosylcobinamide-phosphate guanylyltransferase n=1 Tax=Photobacterium sp. GJ3 TaxID=2829502 RepID=UPI001B8CCC9C|nr:bifunctional adenosylcobinamide kinase/adenosylcobinamide-phosphate guanylyltransferase [Photobacterium sp. GJ3]QUJ70200.1 bifunctional adenosylcobinamide kinase/adenosylcobinamide-phosphate guanylyltransferase [Photobacterium sp. GJ3]
MADPSNIRLILGGARSGKSSYAEKLAHGLSTPAHTLHYVATATAFDEEMQARILHHQQQRGTVWVEHECPLELAALLKSFRADDIVLIECLTLWLNNLIFELGTTCSHDQLTARIAELAATASQCPAQLIFVSNEVGLGVVPMGEVSRTFVDHAGRMNQKIAAIANEVTLIAAGLPLQLKGASS